MCSTWADLLETVRLCEQEELAGVACFPLRSRGERHKGRLTGPAETSSSIADRGSSPVGPRAV